MAAEREYRYWLKANAGQVEISLVLLEQSGKLKYNWHGMGSHAESFQLVFEHQAITSSTGLLFLKQAYGDLVYPADGVSDFEPDEVLFEYVELPESAPFAIDDPGLVSYDAIETYDLLLFVGRFFTDAYINIGDFPAECPEDYQEIAPYCEFARSMQRLDKQKLQRVKDTDATTTSE